MKSRPVYTKLAWDESGAEHIAFIESARAGEGAAMAARLLARPPRGKLALIGLGMQEHGADAAWRDVLPAGAAYFLPRELSAALARLDAELAGASMGARLYLAASEDAIWQAHEVAARHGMSRQQIRCERLGPSARPVRCVHCQALTRGVRQTLVNCSGCSRTLFVREHFSRRLGAYMGFQVDAEVPGALPAAEELAP